MAILIGALLALATGALGTLVGFDRSRTYYPVILIVIAAYYCLFAVMGESDAALWQDSAVMTVFAAAAIGGFRGSLWLVAAGLAAHGAMDLVHHHAIANPGVPLWWPHFCSAFDFAAAAYLAVLLRRRGQPAA